MNINKVGTIHLKLVPPLKLEYHKCCSFIDIHNFTLDSFKEGINSYSFSLSMRFSYEIGSNYNILLYIPHKDDSIFNYRSLQL